MALIYFYLMYSFSMLSAMGTVVFSGVSRRGASAMLTVAIFAYFSNLCGCTTNYSTGPVIIYFGLYYVSPRRGFAHGFLGLWCMDRYFFRLIG